MTVRFENGNAKVPLWAVVTIMVTILLGVTGWIIAAEAKVSDAQHRELAQKDAEIERRVDRVEAALLILPAMQQDIAVIKDRLMGDR